MSMPGKHHCPDSRDQAITHLIDSVAMEQIALSKILCAESEKLKKITYSHCVHPETLLCANKSVKEMVNAIVLLEMVLKAKLELFSCKFCEPDC